MVERIETTAPAERAALLRSLKETYGAHYDAVVGELKDAKLDPITLTLARRLDPVAVQTFWVAKR